MPFFRMAQKLVYFAHVPKCAGSSVEMYLQRRFGPLAFRDMAHYSDPGPRWTRTSPQHVTVDDLRRLIPPRYFFARFTVLRHPVPRLVSMFKFQRDWEGRIAPGTGLTDWLEGVRREQRAMTSYDYDNHLRPMTAFIPEDTHVFRLEEGGLDQIIPWLDTLQGKAAGPREMPVLNTHGGHMAKRGRTPVEVAVSDTDRALIAELYADDFARFGYDPEAVPEEPDLTERPLPPKPRPDANSKPDANPKPDPGRDAQKQALQKGNS